MQKKDWLLFSLLLILLFALETFVVQRFLTSQVPGANDFYSRWHGARAFLLEDRNPYALDVTEEIQPIIGIDPSEVGRGGFNYPLHVIFFFWPLAYLSYDWAQAVWWTVVLWLAIASTIVLFQWLDVKPKPTQLLTFLLVALTFYPITRSVFLGQFTLHILFFLALALLLLKTNRPVLTAVALPSANPTSSSTAGATTTNNNRDFWAGVALSAASIKPQMLILVVPFLLLWALTQKRWRFVYGLLIGGGVFLVASLALMPTWPLEFLADTRRYRQFSGGYTPLQLLLGDLWQIPAALLVLIMLYFWWKSRASDSAFKSALYWTIVVQTLVTFQTGTTNQVLLWILLLDYLASIRTSRGARLSLALTTLVWFAAWTLFVRTLGEHEHPIMFLPISFLTLILLAIQTFREGIASSGSTPSLQQQS
ncbi:MAG: DUF2029 domain-containing protein [Chloroflexi bacterium]|nr:DUF2029 domain-containing protein [Chloroflexota bacterium]